MQPYPRLRPAGVHCPRQRIDGHTCPQLADRLRATGTDTDRFLAGLVDAYHAQVCLQGGAR